MGQGIFDEQIGIGLERLRYRVRIAQRLRCDPILAIGAVEIAAEHSEAVREGSGMSVKKGLLFDGIALHSGDVSPGHVERATLIEPNFANARLPFVNGAAVSASVAANAIAIERFA